MTIFDEKIGVSDKLKFEDVGDVVGEGSCIVQYDSIQGVQDDSIQFL